MRKMDEYLTTIDTIYPDGYARETQFRHAGDMLDPAPGDPAKNIVGRVLRAVLCWQQKRSGRLALRELNADQLRDIGVSRSEARAEFGKSFFWD